MKKLLGVMVLLMPMVLIAAIPPIIRNAYTTQAVDVVDSRVQTFSTVTSNGLQSEIDGVGTSSSTSSNSFQSQLSGITFPDDTTYTFDEEFDTWFGNGNGQFSKYGFVGVSVTSGGGVNNVASNSPPYYGMIEIQSPTATSNTFWVVDYSSTGIMPYQNLAAQSNWVYHAIFFFNVTNVGSMYRIGLVDTSFSGSVGAGFNPSNFVGMRWSLGHNDGNHFVFEARSNAVSRIVASSVVVAQGVPFKLTMFSTNQGVTLFQINNETPVKLTNSPVQSVTVGASAGNTNGVAGRLWLDRLAIRFFNLAR